MGLIPVILVLAWLSFFLTVVLNATVSGKKSTYKEE